MLRTLCEYGTVNVTTKKRVKSKQDSWRLPDTFSLAFAAGCFLSQPSDTAYRAMNKAGPLLLNAVSAVCLIAINKTLMTSLRFQWGT